MKNRLFTWLLCLTILLVISPLQVFAAETVASGTCGDNLTWTLDDAGTLTISGTGAMGDCSATTSPWVTHKDLIKAVILDEGVTAIGDYAFYNCENLTNITLPSTLQTVGEYAFYKCKNLQYVSGTSAIARVYDYAFYGCEKLPGLPGANLRTVGQWAFAYCAALSQMDLQTSMVNDGFGTGAFYGCTSLKKITIPTSVNSIPSSAFSGCSGLETVNAHGQIVTINSSAFSGCVSLTDFSIPGWVTHIYSGAFENSGLGNVSIGASVQYVAPDAFAGCRNLQNINVSSSNSTYKSFSGVLFSNNGTVLYTYPAGRSGEVQIPYTGYALKKIGMYAFSGCSGITGIEVPNQCTNIGSCAFANCTSLTSVTFTATYQGAGATTIGNMAFDGCTSLENIIFPGGMQSIGNGLFANCTGLKQVCIPDSVTSIDATAFTDCINLKDVLYGGTQYEWDDLASDNDDFADVTIHYNIVYYLNHWTVKSKNPTCTTAGYRKEECACGYVRNEETYEPTGEHIFDKQVIADTYWVSDVTCQSPAVYKKSCVCGLASDTETFTVGNAEPDKHNFVDTVCTDCGIIGGQCGSTVYWTLDANGLLTISGTGDIMDYTYSANAPWYEHREAIKTVVMEDGVTGIGNCAFYNCKKLTEATIPAGVTYIGSGAFYECYDMRNITIPEGVIQIGNSAFYGCTSVQSITIPKGVTSIGESAFWNCTGLIEITIPEGIEEIGRNTFYNCYKLREISIPEGVTHIGNEAFYNCNSLVYVTLPTSVTSIGYSTFLACYKLSEIEIPEGVTRIEYAAFEYCNSLRAIVIPETVTSIESYAFYGCSSLNEITIPAGVKSIGGSVFKDCSSLTDVYYGGTETQWDELSNTPDITRIHYNCPTADGHWTEVETPPTCGETGVSFETCSCGYKRNEESIPATGEHNYESVVTPPTCDDAGYTTHTCANCGDTYTSDEVTALGHDLGEWKISEAPTCTEAGAKRRECSRCDHFETEEIAATCHDHEAVVTSPTCEEDGYTTYTCTNCGDTYIGDKTSAEGHIWSEATCSDPIICSVCHAIEEGTALGHSFGPWVEIKAPSASEEGLEKHTCTRCGHTEERAIEKLNNPFEDVYETSFYYAPVLWALENNITKGVDTTHFGPDQSCNRSQVVTFLWRAVGKPEPTSTKNPFVDVKETDFFYKPVLWALENNITKGVDATHFGPDQNCNRSQVVTFLWRAIGRPEPTSTTNPFVDSKETDFFYKPVLWALEHSITKGVDTTHFGPNQICNRGQVVTFLHRTFND